MRIEKYIGLWLLAGLAAACQKEIVESAEAQYSTEAILFTTPYTVSKSEAMRYGDFKKGDRVGVLGYCRAESTEGTDYSTSPWDTKKEFATPEVFYNEELTYEGEGVLTYTYDAVDAVGGLHPWYDDVDYTYAFFAYYPYVELERGNPGTISGGTNGQVDMGTIKLSGENETGDPTITYTMPHKSGRDMTAQSNKLELDVVPDLMLAYRIDHKKGDGAVPLNFRHMLCAFEFEVNNYNTEVVTINSLVFWGTDFYKSFSITGQEQKYTPSDEHYSGYFTLVSSDQPVTCPAAENADGVLTPGHISITEAGGNSPVDLLFIPDGNGKITEGECSVEVQTSEGNRTIQNVKDGMSFEPGTRSIFSINIIGNSFVIEVRSGENWSDGGDSNIYFD